MLDGKSIVGVDEREEEDSAENLVIVEGEGQGFSWSSH
jgi:hypothetical protein